MNALAKKVASLLPELESRGPVYFYALAERNDINQWDVVLSAEWSDINYTSAIRQIADALVSRLQPAELTALSGVTVVPSTEPDIQEMPRSLEKVSPQEEKLIELTLAGLEVRRAFIFKAQRPLQQEPSPHAVMAV